jgi:hypothetical protein
MDGLNPRLERLWALLLNLSSSAAGAGAPDHQSGGAAASPRPDRERAAELLSVELARLRSETAAAHASLLTRLAGLGSQLPPLGPAPGAALPPPPRLGLPAAQEALERVAADLVALCRQLDVAVDACAREMAAGDGVADPALVQPLVCSHSAGAAAGPRHATGARGSPTPAAAPRGRSASGTRGRGRGRSASAGCRRAAARIYPRATAGVALPLAAACQLTEGGLCAQGPRAVRDGGAGLQPLAFLHSCGGAGPVGGAAGPHAAARPSVMTARYPTAQRPAHPPPPPVICLYPWQASPP